MSLPADLDPTLDLVIDRVLPVSPEKIYRAWTTAAHIKRWFVPRPWHVSDCELDLRPGGRFFTVMNGPNGERFENMGCYLEVVPNERLVFTDTLLPGFRPSPNPFFTAFLILEPHPDGARYIAIARHGNPETCQKHEQMGFHNGWNVVVDQLVEAIQEDDGVKSGA